MDKGRSLKKWVANLILLFAGVATVCFMLACAENAPVTPRQLPPAPSSAWGDSYSYKYDPPEKKDPASIPATIVVVNPIYKEAESALIDPTYSKVAKGFSASMGVDMDKVVIAKGMTVKGPYLSLDDITYSDKKISDLTLAPKVFLTTRIKYVGEPVTREYRNDEGKEEVRVDRKFEMKIGGWISFVMQEPLSAEKMWIKRLELDDAIIQDIESYEAIGKYHTSRGGCFDELEHTTLIGYDRGKLLYDGKVDAMANMLKKIYPVIMEKCWIYIDTQEVLSLKEKTKEIRVLKRY
jgi:hypothetical protein